MSQTTYLSVREVAEMLNVCEKWVYEHQMQIPGRIRIGGCLRWDETVLLDTLKEWATKPARCKCADGGDCDCETPCGNCARRLDSDRHKLLSI